MVELRRIKDSVDLALSTDFLEADDPSIVVEFDAAQDTEIAREDIDVAPIGSLIDTVMHKFAKKPAAADREIVVQLHRQLPLTRREAADQRIWAWLGAVQHPHFVAWRWKPGRTGLRSHDRFVGNRVRQTHARLWWAAELTRSGESDYSLTEHLLSLNGFQDIYEAIFGRAFCQYHPAIQSFIEIAGQYDEKTVRETAKEFGYILTTLVLETMNKSEIDSLLTDIVSELRSADN